MRAAECCTFGRALNLNQAASARHHEIRIGAGLGIFGIVQIQHRLTGIVEEMGEAMLRTSFSQILNSSRDFSTAICGADSGT